MKIITQKKSDVIFLEDLNKDNFIIAYIKGSNEKYILKYDKDINKYIWECNYDSSNVLVCGKNDISEFSTIEKAIQVAKEENPLFKFEAF